mmetsp:Transcript_91949/g.205475  ORF Transcript_91949/g.205475 Transcript_91949/m.205475 type:complete len:218 (-) Transcript_91949:1084-1737(-)
MNVSNRSRQRHSLNWSPRSLSYAGLGSASGCVPALRGSAGAARIVRRSSGALTTQLPRQMPYGAGGELPRKPPSRRPRPRPLRAWAAQERRTEAVIHRALRRPRHVPGASAATVARSLRNRPPRYLPWRLWRCRRLRHIPALHRRRLRRHLRPRFRKRRLARRRFTSPVHQRPCLSMRCRTATSSRTLPPHRHCTSACCARRTRAAPSLRAVPATAM